MSEMTCVECKDDFDQDDIAWADSEGNLTMAGQPYCVSCLPNQPDYEGENK